MSSPTHQAPTIHNQAINPQGMLGARLAFEYERVRNKTALWGLGRRLGCVRTARCRQHTQGKGTHARQTQTCTPAERHTNQDIHSHGHAHLQIHTRVRVPHAHRHASVSCLPPQLDSNSKKTTTVDVYRVRMLDDIQSLTSDVQEIFLEIFFNISNS